MTYSWKTCESTANVGAVLLAVGASQAHATAYLFTSTGARNVRNHGRWSGLLTVSRSMATSPCRTITRSESAWLRATSYRLPGEPCRGQIDFSDTASTTTGGSCPADVGGVCKVNTISTIAAGSTITGLTQLNVPRSGTPSANGRARRRQPSGWSAGATNGNVSLASSGSICVGDAFTGCTIANLSTASATTRTVNGVVQTAYVLNISSTTIGGTITIKGNGSALVILQYSGGTKLTTGAGSKVTLTGGITNDQVLLDDTGTGGIDTSSGFNYTGAMAVSPTAGTMNLNALVMNGRLFVQQYRQHHGEPGKRLQPDDGSGAFDGLPDRRRTGRHRPAFEEKDPRRRQSYLACRPSTYCSRA